MWSVFTGPCLVATVVPSISGSRSRCTPSRDTSAPMRPSRAQILSISSRKTMPFFSTDADRLLHELLVVEQLVGFLVDQQSDANPCTVTRRVLVRPPPSLPNMSPMIDRAHLRARHAGNLEHRHAAAGLAAPRSRSPCRRARRRAASCGSSRGSPGSAPGPTSASSTRSSAACSALAPARPCACCSRVSAMRDLDQVAHDLLDVAADIADLGELGRLDLEERRAGELGQAARDLGLADAGRADHQDVLRQHLLAQLVVELQPAPAVAQRDGDGALGVVLADDEAVEFGDDFAGREVGHASIVAEPEGMRSMRRRRSGLQASRW